MNLIQNTGINELIPLKFYLSQNYPNPFKDKTIIKYCVAYKTDVTVTIYNSEHKVIKSFFWKRQEAGTYEIEFSAKFKSDPICNHKIQSKDINKAGYLPAGIYYYNLKAGDYSAEKKMRLIK